MSVRGQMPVETAGGVPLRLPLASAGERLAAFIADLGMLAALYVGLQFMLEDWLDGSNALLLLVGFVIRHGYFTLFELLWQGATPGKRMVGIRVFCRDGGLPASAILARNLMRDVEMTFPLVVMAAPEAFLGEAPTYLWVPATVWTVGFVLLPLLTRDRTRAGDLVGGTVVLRVPHAPLHLDEAASAGRRPLRFRPEHLSVYGEKELEALARLLRDVDPDTNAGAELTLRVAKTISEKIGWTDRVWAEDPETFLRQLYGAQRSHLERQLLFGRRKVDKHAKIERV